MKYEDFVNTKYKPAPSDTICTFRIEPLDPNRSMQWAAGGVAAESSIGTWTELTTEKPYMKQLAATVFELSNQIARIAYPIELFEPGNLPNIMSSIAGNVFGLGDLKYLRLLDIQLAPQLIKSFPGPAFGIPGIRKALKVPKRPLVGTIIKPKLGLRTKDHAAVAYSAWVGGCDIVKDDENLSSQKFNPFEKRVIETLDKRDRAEEETGDRKVYLINVTAETKEMLRRAEFVEDHGGRVAMIDILTCGFSAVATLRNQGFNLILHGHRAMHAAFTKLPEHGIAMPVIAVVSRLLGIDQLHVGTAVGKMSEDRQEVETNIRECTQPLQGLLPTLPVASGGLHPRHVPQLIDIFGKDVVIQAGGGIHGHPRGTEIGATAMRQAVDAVLEGQTLSNYAKSHSPLAEALQHFPSN
ncbi:MAG: type III ribulose-bisphosphate carboxylase [Candidatus Hermodarchaeota archaeon]|nr:type III ribulose-bisphosphate carboxylase [Candidatus Hermodarchaeota archaeon]